MKVIALVKSTKESEAGHKPEPSLIEAMNRFNQELIKAGVFVTAGGLEPSSAGVRINYHDGQITQTPGPFTATSELVSGMWIWEVASMEDAIAWAKRAPFPATMHTVVELRGFWG